MRPATPTTTSTRAPGNWPFNTAYAANYSLDTFVTRLDSLRDAEAYIRAGIPLVASVAFGRGQLTGAPISSTPGHLLVIRGFTAAGQVIVNDPAAAKNSDGPPHLLARTVREGVAGRQRRRRLRHPSDQRPVADRRLLTVQSDRDARCRW